MDGHHKNSIYSLPVNSTPKFAFGIHINNYERFWIDTSDMAIKWCEENLDDTTWFFDSDCFYVREDINIMAFKLRWS